MTNSKAVNVFKKIEIFVIGDSEYFLTVWMLVKILSTRIMHEINIFKILIVLIFSDLSANNTTMFDIEFRST